MKLYDFFRSGSSHRLRIALNLKGISYEREPVNLRAGDHRTPSYLLRNPQGLVPTLQLDDQTCLTQSPAIIEALEEFYPSPALLPKDPIDRAKARAMSALIGCDIHPINNLRVLNALRRDFGADEPAVREWCQRWITAGFEALEKLLPDSIGTDGFAFDDKPGLVEIYLVPQVFSARRFETDLSPFTKIVALDATCASLPEFRDAVPEAQADAV